MISLGALLVVVCAASIPVTYILLMSRWIEPEARLAGLDSPAPKATREAKHELVEKHA